MLCSVQLPYWASGALGRWRGEQGPLFMSVDAINIFLVECYPGCPPLLGAVAGGQEDDDQARTDEQNQCAPGSAGCDSQARSTSTRFFLSRDVVTLVQQLERYH
jgi:hypothetical protein